MEDNGYIDLYFGDQSHFGLSPNVPYAWQTKDNQILLPAAIVTPKFHKEILNPAYHYGYGY